MAFVFICVIVLLIFLAWWIIKRKLLFWKYPGFKDDGHWYFGNIPEIRHLAGKLVYKFPDFYRFSKGLGQYRIACYNLDLFQKVMKNSDICYSDLPFLFKMFRRTTLQQCSAEDWKLYRRIFAHCYGLGMNDSLTEICIDIFESHINKLDLGEDFKQIDFDKLMTEIAYNCSNVLWFGSHIYNSERPFIKKLNSMYASFIKAKMVYKRHEDRGTGIIRSVLDDIKTAIEIRTLRKEFDETHEQILQKRIQHLDICKRENFNGILEQIILLKTSNKLTVTDKQISDLFVSHHSFLDSMRDSLSKMIVFLGRDFKLQERVRYELIKTNTNISEKSIFQKSQYLKNVYNESLRLVTAGFQLSSRILTKPISFRNFVFPKGMVFHIDYNYIHCNPLFWNDPEKFQPKRFEESLEMFQFVPFSIGPRVCPGRSLVQSTFQNIYKILILRAVFETDKDNEAILHMRRLNVTDMKTSN